MKKNFLVIALCMLLFPSAVFAKPCADAVKDTPDLLTNASCAFTCGNGTAPVEGYDCPVSLPQCCGTPNLIAPDAPAKAGLSEGGACKCSFTLTPGKVLNLGVPGAFTAACSAFSPPDGVVCSCGPSSAQCVKTTNETQSDCVMADAEMKKSNNDSSLVAVSGAACNWTPPAAAIPPAPVKKCVSTPYKSSSGIGQLNLSGINSCCMSVGDCTLDDIVKTGAAFANLLTQLSAAFFFATFVYGGAMYLLSFGDKGRVDKGKKAITGAAIGMLIVLMAWTVVNYLANSLQGK